MAAKKKRAPSGLCPHDRRLLRDLTEYLVDRFDIAEHVTLKFVPYATQFGRASYDRETRKAVVHIAARLTWPEAWYTLCEELGHELVGIKGDHKMDHTFLTGAADYTLRAAAEDWMNDFYHPCRTCSKQTH